MNNVCLKIAVEIDGPTGPIGTGHCVAIGRRYTKVGGRQSPCAPAPNPRQVLSPCGQPRDKTRLGCKRERTVNRLAETTYKSPPQRNPKGFGTTNSPGGFIPGGTKRHCFDNRNLRDGVLVPASKTLGLKQDPIKIVQARFFQ